MPIILHIGAHKTGTTLIQSAFDRNSGALLREGVFYPKCNWFHHAQHRLAFALRGRIDPVKNDHPDAETELAALDAAISKRSSGETTFVSSEELFSLPVEKIAQLRDRLSHHDIYILAVLRRPDEMMISSYNQNIKSPGNTFKFPFTFFQDKPLKLTRDLAMKECIDNWAEVFGQERILLRRFEDEAPLAMALRAVGMPTDFISGSARINASTPFVVGEVMRVAKVIEMAPKKREKLFQLANRLFEGEPRLEPGTAFRRSVLADMKEELDSLFAAYGMENTYTPASVPDDLEAGPPSRLAQQYAKIVDHLL